MVSTAAQHPADPVQRVAGVAPVAARLVLDPAADVVEAGEPELDDVEAVQHSGGVGQGHAQSSGVPPERVERGHHNTGPPQLGLAPDPLRKNGSRPAGGDIEQQGGPHVDHPGDERGVPVGVGTQERRLVHPQRADPLQAGRVPHQRHTKVPHRGHHRRPAHPERQGHLGHAVPVLPDPPARLHPGPFGPRAAGPDRRVGLGPRPHRAPRLVAAPHPLHPHQGHWTTTRRQVPHPHRAAGMHPRNRPTRRATHHATWRLHRLLKLTVALRDRHQLQPVEAEHHRRCTTVHHHLGPPDSCPRHHESRGPRPQLRPKTTTALPPNHDAQLRRARYQPHPHRRQAPRGTPDAGDAPSGRHCTRRDCQPR